MRCADDRARGKIPESVLVPKGTPFSRAVKLIGKSSGAAESRVLPNSTAVPTGAR